MQVRQKERDAMHASTELWTPQAYRYRQQIQDFHTEEERFNRIVAKLEQELQEHDLAIEELNSQLRRLEGDVNVLRRNKYRTGKTDSGTRQGHQTTKNRWMIAVGIAVLSIAVTWGQVRSSPAQTSWQHNRVSESES